MVASGAGEFAHPRHARSRRRSWATRVVAVWLFALGGCASTLPPNAFESGTPAMRPERFFAGTTRSTGVLEDRDGAPTRRLQVEGHGVTAADGSLRLEQTIAIDDDAEAGGTHRTRTWILRAVDAHRYVGTLSDAGGPVEGEAYGNVFHLRHAMKTPIGGRMEQWLYLQPDGRTVVNEATVRVFGFVVAHLSERITRED